jgi:hypothetical protein
MGSFGSKKSQPQTPKSFTTHTELAKERPELKKARQAKALRVARLDRIAQNAIAERATGSRESKVDRQRKRKDRENDQRHDQLPEVLQVD